MVTITLYARQKKRVREAKIKLIVLEQQSVHFSHSVVSDAVIS